MVRERKWFHIAGGCRHAKSFAVSRRAVDVLSYTGVKELAHRMAWDLIDQFPNEVLAADTWYLGPKLHVWFDHERPFGVPRSTEVCLALDAFLATASETLEAFALLNRL